jgi:hypothetical protein
MYRLFLLRRGKIAAHHEFRAENDIWACRAVALAFDACTDYCDDFELWYGVSLVTSRAGLKTPANHTETDVFREARDTLLDAAVQDIAATILEGVMRTSDALRDSPTVKERLNGLRGRSVAP